MRREYHRWYSPRLNRDMELLVFGHGGAAVLVFPTSMGRFYEYENFGMIEALHTHLERGWLQIFCVDSVDSESWYNRSAHPHDRAVRHNQYEDYLLHEVVPFIRMLNGTPFLIATGCSLGAYSAANFTFKHPTVVQRLLAVSGQYDLHFLAHGYDDDEWFFNSPLSYLPTLHDDHYLIPLRERVQITLCVGGWGDICHRGTQDLATVLRDKGIPHTLDVWDQAWHDWPWWRQMTLKHI